MANHAGTFQSRFFPVQPETEGDDPIFNTLLGLSDSFPTVLSASSGGFQSMMDEQTKDLPLEFGSIPE